MLLWSVLHLAMTQRPDSWPLGPKGGISEVAFELGNES